MNKSGSEEGRRFETGSVLAIAGCHFSHDLYTAFVAPLLPLLIKRLSLSLLLAGSLTAYLQVPSLLNPVIGYLDDRFNLRLCVILAPAVSATLMSCVGLAATYWALALLFLVTGFSIAAFHAPAPAMVSHVSGDRLGKGMSIFMAAGELARSVGPLFAIWAVSTWSLEGIWRIAVFGWVASLVLFWRFRSVPLQKKRRHPLRAIFSIATRLFLPLFLILLGRSFLLSSIGVYLPTYLERNGATLWFAAGSLSIYEFAGVGGALLSGTLSDRLGRKPVLLTAMLTSALLMLALIQAAGWLLIPILIGLGFVALSAQPVMLAIVQDHLPDHRSTASGFYLAMSFVLRPAAAVVIGALGDQVGLQGAIFWSAMVVLLSVPIVLLLPEAPPSAPGRDK